VQEIHGALRVGGGLEDGPLVVLEDFEPAIEKSGVVIAKFQRKAEIGSQ